ncbi:DUF86 domain-containing protein [Candidatus Bathyarchaeota archaeon]|nr:DUF86 domain-containing protein [Candidatus Bathyarchaeota archaeon]
MKTLVCLRNLLVHQYWNVDDKHIHNSLKDNLKCIHEILASAFSKCQDLNLLLIHYLKNKEL